MTVLGHLRILAMCDDPYLYDDYKIDADYWYEQYGEAQAELEEALQKIKELEAALTELMPSREIVGGS